MAATARQPGGQTAPRLTRDQVAEHVVELGLLGEEPQSGAELARRAGVTVTIMNQALGVLDARAVAKRIGRSGWVLAGAAHDAEMVLKIEHDGFPYKPLELPFDQMFVDGSYQRPLTDFVTTIQQHFNPFLWQPLVVNDRGPKERPRWAIIDGQTRWTAARRLGIQVGPCSAFTGDRALTREQEAEMFELLQSERRGNTPWHRFRATLVQGETTERGREALQIKRLVEGAGYTLGDQQGQLGSVGACRQCYRKDPFLLERVLIAYYAAFGDSAVPRAPHIKGLHYWYRNPGYQFLKRGQDVDDERLARRLRTAGLSALTRRASAAKEYATGGERRGNPDLYMAQAIDAVYKGGGRA